MDKLTIRALVSINETYNNRDILRLVDYLI